MHEALFRNNSLSDNLDLICNIFIDHNLIQSSKIYSRLHNASILFEIDPALLLEISSSRNKYGLPSYELRLLEKEYKVNKRQIIFEVRLPVQLDQFMHPKEYEPICMLFHNRIDEYYLHNKD